MKILFTSARKRFALRLRGGKNECERPVAWRHSLQVKIASDNSFLQRANENIQSDKQKYHACDLIETERGEIALNTTPFNNKS